MSHQPRMLQPGQGRVRRHQGYRRIPWAASQSSKRSNAGVFNRCLVCLDEDNAGAALMDDLDMTFINAYALNSTYSHRSEKIRLGLIIPLSSTVTRKRNGALIYWSSTSCHHSKTAWQSGFWR